MGETRRHNRCGLGDPNVCGHPDCPDPMTPAVPDPTVEARNVAERAEQDTRALADDLHAAAHQPDPGEETHCQECYDNACEVMDTPWLTRYLAEHTERAVREALAAAADNMPVSRPGQPYEHAADWLRRRAEAIYAARIVREGGRP